MQVQEGKRYWTRAGGITPPIARNNKIVFVWTDGPHTYGKEGQFQAEGEAEHDLVAVYDGPELVKPLVPEVGKRYVTKQGFVTPIVKLVSELYIWYPKTSEDGEAGYLISRLERAYLGKDDPINQGGVR